MPAKTRVISQSMVENHYFLHVFLYLMFENNVFPKSTARCRLVRTLCVCGVLMSEQRVHLRGHRLDEVRQIFDSKTKGASTAAYNFWPLPNPKNHLKNKDF